MNKKGFTMIELIAVMIVMSILLLLARPSFLNSKVRYDESQILISAKMYETNIKKEILKDSSYLNKLDKFKREDLPYKNPVIYSVKGEVKEEEVVDGIYYLVPNDLIDFSADIDKHGDFYFSEKKEAVYFFFE